MSVQAYFQSRAEQFDSLYVSRWPWQAWLNRLLRAGLYERVALALGEVRGLKDFTLLDVGCGSGRNALLMAQAGASKVIGIDVAPAMIDLARRLENDSTLTQKVEFMEGDFYRAGFEQRFDVCLALGFFDYVRDPVPALARMAALATHKVIASFPGSSLVRGPLRKLRYALCGCPVYFYSRERLERILGEAGLSHYKIIPYASSGFLLVAEISEAAPQRGSAPAAAADSGAGLRAGRIARGCKRAFDFFCSLVLLLLFSPLMALVAIAVRITLGAPVLFRQERPGQMGRSFTLLKFRTMTEARDANGHLLPEAQRLTRLGRKLRRFSLDELPQLWNVLKGEMSLVGPRPLLTQYLGRYTPEQARRHAVPPGITGWAQVHGRNVTSWSERFALDLWYVEHWSLALDFKILLKTAGRVIAGKGIAPVGMAVMPEFTGARGEDQFVPAAERQAIKRQGNL